MPTHRRNIGLMSFFTVVVTLTATLMVPYPNVALGQGVPKIDVVPSCKAAAAGYAGISQEFESCRKSEEAARDILVKEWDNFVASDRSSCYRLTTTGTPGTYTELLTCLEMRRDARALPTADDIRKADRPPRRSPTNKMADPEPPAAR